MTILIPVGPKVVDYVAIGSKWADYKDMKVKDIKSHLKQNNFNCRSLRLEKTEQVAFWALGLILVPATVGLGSGLGCLTGGRLFEAKIIFGVTGGMIATKLLIAGVCGLRILRDNNREISPKQYERLSEELSTQMHNYLLENRNMVNQAKDLQRQAKTFRNITFSAHK